VRVRRGPQRAPLLVAADRRRGYSAALRFFPMLSSGSVIIFIKGQSTANQHFSSRNKRSKNRKKKEKENPDAGGEA
jgi:hypothetical protein